VIKRILLLPELNIASCAAFIIERPGRGRAELLVKGRMIQPGPGDIGGCSGQAADNSAGRGRRLAATGPAASAAPGLRAPAFGLGVQAAIARLGNGNQKAAGGTLRNRHRKRHRKIFDAQIKPLDHGGKSPDGSHLAAGLYILATPIGNARDISLRTLETLKGCDVIAAEDTRVTSKLLAIHRISKPLIPYNDHMAADAAQDPGPAGTGSGVALVSDAGTPLVSDPVQTGARAVAAGALSWPAGASAVLRGSP